ncbi:MAG: helix-turn-helix domain-containing protein [Pseudomonadota bacterium]
MESILIDRLTALGHPQRMAVFRLLMRRYPDAVPAGEIAGALGQKASTMSVYLAALTRAGLISRQRSATSLRYRIDLDAVRDLSASLLIDCCRGRPDLCPPDLFLPGVLPDTEGDHSMSDGKLNVLFICTGNSARSVFAEAVLRNEGATRFNAFSAGTRPQSELNPFAVEMLKEKGHDISLLRAKNVEEFQGPDAPQLDFVFTVCDRAANEECPAWPGQPVTAHWGVPDPVKAEGTDAEKRLAFQQAYGLLRNRILGFAALPLETLDRVARQVAVDDIAGLEGAR